MVEIERAKEAAVVRRALAALPPADRWAVVEDALALLQLTPKAGLPEYDAAHEEAVQQWPGATRKQLAEAAHRAATRVLHGDDEIGARKALMREQVAAAVADAKVDIEREEEQD
ncbi:hypothetical protein [Microbacterium sp.]|uniref:hypothetical protein n=1 Tax=Microbacterium sp. TaxID=51671 RepID=UPI0039E3CADA